MLGEATLDVSGTFLGEAIRLLILFAAQHTTAGDAPRRLDRGGRWQTMSMSRCSPAEPRCGTSGGLIRRHAGLICGPVCEDST